MKLDILKGRKIQCMSCGETHGEKEPCRMKAVSDDVQQVKEIFEKEPAPTPPARVRPKLLPPIDEEIEKESVPTSRARIMPKLLPPIDEEIEEEIEEVKEPMLSDVYFKQQVKDENGNVFWVYKCKLCNKDHYAIPVKAIEFIQKFEDES